MKVFVAVVAGAIALSTVSLAQAQAKDQSKADATKQAAPAKPAGGTKTTPEPKTKEENEAMKAVLAKQNDPTAMLAATDDFAAKFPDSTVRGMLYRAVMMGFEQQGNADKAYEVGRKALTIDSDDPLTLSDVAMYLASHTRDSDLDRTERLTEAKKMANDALANIDQIRMGNQAKEADRVQAQNFAKSTAYAALAVAAQADKDWATAETNYQKSVEAAPDSSMMLRLGFAQRMEGKYQAAIATFDKAIELGNKQQTPVVVQLAQQQKEGCQKQLDKQKAAPAATAPATTAPATPKQ